LADGHRKVIGQLPTGGGKTFCFASITQRFIERQHAAGGVPRVLILVHRTELLKQARKSLLNLCGIVAHPIQAGTQWIPDAPVYVGMVESAHRRLAKLPPIGLVIIDEAHLNLFSKIHAEFPDAFFIGFTATPISANKKKPLKGLYSDIVCGPQISELIASGALCQNITVSPRDIVNRAELAIKNGEFDTEGMAQSYSKPKYVQNTVEAYRKHGYEAGRATKCLVFNVNIAHSLAVCEAFREAGYPCRHLDGTETPYRRSEVLRWFAETPDAILCNVAVLTAGFDEPTVETIIVNRATMSMPLWLQITGRGSRVTEFKRMFKIIDLGGNAITHGDWNADRNWSDLFHNPKKPKEAPQVAPCKSCPACDSILPAGIRVCPYCGYEYPSREEELEGELGDFVIVTRGIDVERLMQENANLKEYYTFFLIGRQLAAALRHELGPRGLTDEKAEFALREYHRLAKEWCAKSGKRWNAWHGERAKETLWAELAACFKDWVRPELRIPEDTPVSAQASDMPFIPPKPKSDIRSAQKPLPREPEPSPYRQSIPSIQTIQNLSTI